MMNREEALKRVKKEVKTVNLVKHMLAVEACMRALAGKLGEDQELWGLAGILHDLDYEHTKDSPQEHGKLTCCMLADDGLPRELLDAILAHNYHKPCESDMELALFAVDPTSGFLVACALMHPEKKLSAIDITFVKNRLKEKRFAAGASREQMAEGGKLCSSMEDFLETCLQAMQGISKELEL